MTVRGCPVLHKRLSVLVQPKLGHAMLEEESVCWAAHNGFLVAEVPFDVKGGFGTCTFSFLAWHLFVLGLF
jgi:hypothetical protein